MGSDRSDIVSEYTHRDSDESDGRSSYDGEDESDDEIQEMLTGELNSIEATGSWAISGVLEDFPTPGIAEGGEPIAMPLTEEAAEKLASKHHQAPLSKKEALQIDTEKINIKNPAWNKFVNGRLIERVAEELGVSPNLDIHAELFKSLLYTPGSMCKVLTATDKAPDPFATLVVCLPSKHKGGTVKLQHRQKSITLSTDQRSEFDLTYLAWYNDVTPEIEKVDDGYLWTLMYHLVVESPTYQPSAWMLESQIDTMSQVLSQWSRLEYRLPLLVYPLDGEYDSEFLAYPGLEGRNRHVAQLLNDACARHGGISLFLARLKTSKVWQDNYYDPAEDGPHKTKIKRIDYRYILRVNDCAVDNPAIRDIQTCSDKYHGTSHLQFWDPAILIVPHIDIFTTIFGPKPKRTHVSETLREWRSKVERPKPGAAACLDEHDPNMFAAHLKLVCRAIVDSGFTKFFHDVAMTAMFFHNRSLFNEVAKKRGGSWISHYWYELGELFDGQGSSVETADIVAALSNTTTCVEFMQRFCAFGAGLDKSHNNGKHMIEWFIGRVVHMLDHCRGCGGMKDARVVVDVLLLQHDMGQDLRRAVEGFILRKRQDAEFINALSLELLRELSPPNLSVPTHIQDIFRQNVDMAISNFYLPLWHHWTEHVSRYKGITSHPGRGKFNITFGRLLGEFYRQAHMHDSEAASALLVKLWQQIEKTSREISMETLTCFIKELFLVLKASPTANQSFQAIVEISITKFVGAEPAPPKDWASPDEVFKECDKEDCRLCGPINVFLKDPEREKFTLHLSWAEKTHITSSTPWDWPRFSEWETEKSPENEQKGIWHLKKTRKAWKKIHSPWKSRFEEVQRCLLGLDQDSLKDILGAKYESLTALEHVKYHPDSAERGADDQPPDEDEGGTPPKRARDQGSDNVESEATSKRARVGEQESHCSERNDGIEIGTSETANGQESGGSENGDGEADGGAE